MYPILWGKVLPRLWKYNDIALQQEESQKLTGRFTLLRSSGRMCLD